MLTKTQTTIVCADETSIRASVGDTYTSLMITDKGSVGAGNQTLIMFKRDHAHALRDALTAGLERQEQIDALPKA